MIDRDYVAQQIEKLCEHGNLKEQLEKRADDYVNIPELAAYIIDAEKKVYVESDHSPGASYAHMFFQALLPLLMSCLLSATAADVAPVVHGRWIALDNCANEGVYCSACRKKVYRADYASKKFRSLYCPNCGAKMDKEDSDG